MTVPLLSTSDVDILTLWDGTWDVLPSWGKPLAGSPFQASVAGALLLPIVLTVSFLEEEAKTLSSLAVSLRSKQFQNIYVTDPWKTEFWSSHDSMKDCLLMASLISLNLTASLCHGPALGLLV